MIHFCFNLGYLLFSKSHEICGDIKFFGLKQDNVSFICIEYQFVCIVIFSAKDSIVIVYEL